MSIKYFKNLFPFFIYLIIVLLNATYCKKKVESSAPFDIPVLDDRIHFISAIAAPDTTSSPKKFYFGLETIAYGPRDTLFAFDVHDCQIIVFSVSSGKELFRFGRKGEGPGEFSSFLASLSFLPAQGLTIIDNDLRRITTFTSHGGVIKSFKLPLLTENVIIIDDSLLVMSNFLLVENWKPLRLFNYKTNKILCQFGKIVEPTTGLFKAIATSPFRASDEELFSYGFMTRIVYLAKEKRVVLSQTNPYCLSCWSLCSDDGKFFQVKVPFSTEKGFKYKVKGDSRIASLLPTARIFGPFVVNSMLVAVIFDPQCKENYLDTYSLDGIFLNRYRIPALPQDVRIKSVDFDDNNRMFILVNEKKEDMDWIEVYKCDIGT
jgi:hypothetical protein